MQIPLATPVTPAAPAAPAWLKPEMQALGEWLDDLEWTPENAEAHVRKLCLALKNKKQHVWKHFLPRIGEGLSCIGHDPDELHRILALATNAAHVQMETLKPLAMLLASVGAQLPDRLIRAAARNGGLLLALENKHYSVAKRLDWLKTYRNSVLYQGDVLMHLKRMESPIKDAVALWCFFEATQGDVAFDMWRIAGLTSSVVAKKKFLTMYAPEILDKLELIQTLKLSYVDAVNMLGDAGQEAELMLMLPDISAVDTPSKP